MLVESDMGKSTHSCFLLLYLFSETSLREQLAELRQAIRSSADVTLLQQYEDIVQALLAHIQDNRLQCQQLETSLKRYTHPSI